MTNTFNTDNDHPCGPPRFMLDTAAARMTIDAMIADDAGPALSYGSPARAIESLFYDLSPHVICPPGYQSYDIGLYPLVYEANPDGVLLVVRRPHLLPALASGSLNWDELAPPDAHDRDLTADEALDIVAGILRHANDLLARVEPTLEQ